MFTYKYFTSYADHPKQRNCTSSGLCSTAAGAYQFVKGTWARIALKLGLDDFSPENQDMCAVELLRERGCYEDVLAGNFERAIRGTTRHTGANKEWASLPESPANQPKKTWAQAKAFYTNAGGQFA